MAKTKFFILFYPKFFIYIVTQIELLLRFDPESQRLVVASLYWH